MGFITLWVQCKMNESKFSKKPRIFWKTQCKSNIITKKPLSFANWCFQSQNHNLLANQATIAVCPDDMHQSIQVNFPQTQGQSCVMQKGKTFLTRWSSSYVCPGTNDQHFFSKDDVISICTIDFSKLFFSKKASICERYWIFVIILLLHWVFQKMRGFLENLDSFILHWIQSVIKTKIC